ncbi:hypothetical protein PHLCEN_2v7300 [Hermanssonia centrifuga]|uniref:Peptidase A1 domain-containing protein n=1 Tax=Hermanssonia centrifuga TaxID=98765 RepID=A0A2R6NWX7_9APHY|nr:hypothetical protein PHLCEN_2v7300 [Hermanssonia centrifuga]
MGVSMVRMAWFSCAFIVLTRSQQSTGTSKQDFNFTLSTSTGFIYVAGTNDYANNAVTTYNETASTTSHVLRNDITANILGQLTDVAVVKETCGFVTSDSSLWSYENQTIILPKDQTQSALQQSLSMQLGSEISGIVGLGTNRRSKPSSNSWNTSSPSSTSQSVFQPDLNDSIAGQFFLRSPASKNFTFGMALEPPIASASGQSVTGTNAGVLHLLQPDTQFYDTASVSWVNASVTEPTNNGTLPQSDWSVILDGWVMNGEGSELTSKGQIVGNFDPLFTNIYMPEDQATLIHTEIFGSSFHNNYSTLGNLSKAWTVPCDTELTFGLVIGSQTFEVDRSILVIDHGNGVCVSGIEGWTNIFESQYMFGSRFLSSVYLIFNVASSGAQTVGVAPRRMDPSSPSSNPASSKLDVDAIIGGVIGGTAILVLALLAASYLHRKYKTLLSTERVSDYYRSRGVINDDDDLKSPGYIEPFMLMSPLSAAAAAAATSPATGTASRTPHQGLRPPSPKKSSPPRVSIPFLEIRNGAPAPQASDIADISGEARDRVVDGFDSDGSFTA